MSINNLPAAKDIHKDKQYDNYFNWNADDESDDGGDDDSGGGFPIANRRLFAGTAIHLW